MANVTPKIGSYTNPAAAKKSQAAPDVPADIKIEDKRPKEATPSKSMLSGIQTELEHGVAENKATVEKAKTYDEILEENEISKDKAHRIVDDMLHKGYYEEDIEVTRSAIVTFRTRTRADYVRYLRALELLNPRFIDEQNEIMQRYYLTASLVAFKGETFSHPNPKNATEKQIEDAFSARLAWVQQQSETLVFLLAQKLAKFDRVVSIVMSEGVVENF